MTDRDNCPRNRQNIGSTTESNRYNKMNDVKCSLNGRQTKFRYLFIWIRILFFNPIYRRNSIAGVNLVKSAYIAQKRTTKTMYVLAWNLVCVW